MSLQPTIGEGGPVVHLAALPLADEEVVGRTRLHMPLLHVDSQFFRGGEGPTL